MAVRLLTLIHTHPNVALAVGLLVGALLMFKCQDSPKYDPFGRL